MSGSLPSAPVWQDQPAALPLDVVLPVATPPARSALRAVMLDLADIAGHSDGRSVFRASHVAAALAVKEDLPAPPAQTQEPAAVRSAAIIASPITAACTRVPLIKGTDPELRLAMAAHAATKAIRARDPQAIHARFRRPAPDGTSREVIVEHIDQLTSEGIAQRLRAVAEPTTTASVNLDLVDLTLLGLESVQMSPGALRTIVLGKPTVTVVSAVTAAGSTSLAMAETIEITVAPDASDSLPLAAAILGSVAGALDPQENA